MTLPVQLFAVVGARSAWTCKWTSATWNLQHINDIKTKMTWTTLVSSSLYIPLLLSNAVKIMHGKKTNNMCTSGMPHQVFALIQGCHLTELAVLPTLEMNCHIKFSPIDTIPSSPVLTPFWLWGSSSSAGFRIRFANLADWCCASWWIEALFSHDGIEHFPHNGASYRCGTCVVTYPYYHMRFPCSSVRI